MPRDVRRPGQPCFWRSVSPAIRAPEKHQGFLVGATSPRLLAVPHLSSRGQHPAPGVKRHHQSLLRLRLEVPCLRGLADGEGGRGQQAPGVTSMAGIRRAHLSYWGIAGLCESATQSSAPCGSGASEMQSGNAGAEPERGLKCPVFQVSMCPLHPSSGNIQGSLSVRARLP